MVVVVVVVVLVLLLEAICTSRLSGFAEEYFEYLETAIYTMLMLYFIRNVVNFCLVNVTIHFSAQCQFYSSELRVKLSVLMLTFPHIA